MELWTFLLAIAFQLRPAFNRNQTFLWFLVVLAATCARREIRYVSDMVRALGLPKSFYPRFLAFFHSSAVRLDDLARLWTAVVLRVAAPSAHKVNGRHVVLADGIKIPKSGRKMPAVKKLHQQSQNNGKPEFIFGHSCQAISLVVNALGSAFALPLACRIHEGLVASNRDKRTLLDKLIELFGLLQFSEPCYLVADAYYAAAKIVRGLKKNGAHLVCAMRSTSVAFHFPPAASGPRRRGRPKTYGQRVRLATLFDDSGAFEQIPSPVYGETGVNVLIRRVDLLWRPIGDVARFVLVNHPLRGKIILLCTDLSLAPVEILRLYSLRFKIELSFKQAIHVVGAYAYHFWMATMKPRPRKAGNQHLHREPAKYRQRVYRKFHAYQCHIQIALIAQGLMQLAAILRPQLVWTHFASWMCTRRHGIPPSEWVVSHALRNALPDFLADSTSCCILKKFLRTHIDPQSAEGNRLVS